MPLRPRILAVSTAALGATLLLGGCAMATETAAGEGERVQVVASTNVYGDIVAQLGGDRVEVTSIITSTSQDPHSYEASARDQLTISRADLIVENGGGYDAFIDALVEASGTDADVLTAVEFSHDYPENEGHDAEADADHDHADEDGHDRHNHIEGFNEHVWYDPHTIAHLAEDITAHLTELDPDGADAYAAALAEFTGGIEQLETTIADLAETSGGAQVFATEPVPAYLAAAAEFVDVTPSAFSEAVEEGQDVPPATMLEALDLLASGDVDVVITNAQTGGAETEAVTDAAADAGIPVLAFTELLPDGETYTSWMQRNVDELAGTLTR
ncbi:metal ABC transporter solute-binding protein, Zn/Mn family [Microbacterium sp. bgisy189]|uniref:metal ABC transporter solute-binding protein, Zn/Mn family n=1 Tax=Microbacterium sp. bgisy189 TaxID=3413798 RepID=UPI003EBFA07D